jgi:hypothetical protein
MKAAASHAMDGHLVLVINTRFVKIIQYLTACEECLIQRKASIYLNMHILQ